MKLATLPSKNPSNRDGDLCVVSFDNRNFMRVEPDVSLKLALQNWDKWEPKLRSLSEEIHQGKSAGETLDLKKCLAPLPNAPGFYDGSAYLSHVMRARAARGDKMPESAKTTPLMYQGVSDNLIPWHSDIELGNESYGGDFEGEFGVITTDVPRATPSEKMAPHIALLTFFNDITFRELLKSEIERKFGFLQSKPNSSFAPIVVTPDEINGAWNKGRISLPVQVKWNGQNFGQPHGQEMHFSFSELVAHAAFTRPLAAGSIIGSGTISNEDKTKGFACLTEKRYQEVIDSGTATTPWLKPGDEVFMDVVREGVSVFGCIQQRVKI